jgi:hypothetical protein
MRLRNLIARSAIVGAFVLTVSACTPAQHVDPRQKDPNLPPLVHVTDAPLYWSYGDGTTPLVQFKNPQSDALYLGFNENGSMIRNQGNGKIYYWKLTDSKTMMGTLTVAFKSYQDIPLDVLAALQNPGTVVREKLAMGGKPAQPATTPQQQSQNSDKSGGIIGDKPQKDPNFPPLTGMNDPGVPIYWTNGNATKPVVHFKNPASDVEYLGFNEKGSMLRNMGNGKVYRWNLKENSLTVVANSYKEIPLDELASLQNAPDSVKYYLAQHGRTAQPATVPQQPSPQNPDKSGSVFGDDPQKTLQSIVPAVGVPADITGKNASIKGGVLTFILADGTKSKPYTVVRPAFMANTPQAAGLAGTWLAMEDGGKAMMFNVRADHTVTGKEISPEVVQMLMQGRGKQ